jgi:DNA polymerase III subunit epsilon
MLGVVGAWPTGELLGLDFETTGIDRFNDVPVSYALVSVVEGVVIRSWSGLIDPGREIPSEATAVHGISTERARDEGMPLRAAISLVSDAVIAASARGVPLVGMKLDYDLTILELQARDLCGVGPIERGWCGPVLDAVVIDRHFDPDRQGRRTLVDLCAHYGIEIGNAHDASADAPATTSGRSPPRCCRRPEGDQVLSRSQTMSTPSSSARTTLAGWFLSMWPTRPL